MNFLIVAAHLLAFGDTNAIWINSREISRIRHFETFVFRSEDRRRKINGNNWSNLVDNYEEAKGVYNNWGAEYGLHGNR